jgi:hypothetical protein
MLTQSEPTASARDAFRSAVEFVALAARTEVDGSPVKYQFVGPVTLGVHLMTTGMTSAGAFELASRRVATGLAHLHRLVATALPESPQLAILDEPALVDVMSPGFAIAPDHAIDLMSTAMASLGPEVATGIHCCGRTDMSVLLASGPDMISVPATDDLHQAAGYIQRFLDSGGHVAWGVVPTSGPLPATVELPWRGLSDLWCWLVRSGCDPVALRRQSVVTAECGLAGHPLPVARQIARIVRQVGQRVNEQSTATRFALGA